MNIGFFYALVVSFLFSTVGVLSKIAYGYGIPSANCIFIYSSVVSSIILFTILFTRYKSISFLKVKKKQLFSPVVYGGLLSLFLTSTLSLQSLKYIDTSVQRLIVFSAPIFILLIHIIIREKITKMGVFNTFLTISGLFFVLLDFNFDGPDVKLGVFYAILACFFDSLYTVLTEKEKNKLDPLVYWFYAFLSAALFSIGYVLIVGINVTEIFNPNIKIQILLMLMAVFNYTVPYIYFLKSIDTIGAEKTGIIMTTTIIMSMFFGVFLLGETLTLVQLFGSILVIAASLLSGLKK